MQWQNENLITLAEAATLFPGKKGHGLDVSTIWRWVSRGRRGVHLETIVVGARRYTSREAMARFVDATTRRADLASDSRDEIPSERVDHEAVERQLDAEGI